MDLSFIVCLPGNTKQCTNHPQALIGMHLPYSFNCLVPRFFLILIFKSFSATVIMVSRLMIFSLAYSRSLVSCWIFLFNADSFWSSFILESIWLENSSPKVRIENLVINNFKVFLHKPYLKQAVLILIKPDSISLTILIISPSVLLK